MRRILALAVLLSLSQPALAGEDEQSIRNGIEQHSAKLLAEQQFAALNKLAAQYRTTAEKTPSGIWKLSLFYSGLRTPIEGDQASEEQWRRAFALSENWVRSRPSPAAYVALANLRIGYAWHLRGTGLAKTVPPEKWSPFHEQLRIADGILAANQANAKLDPEFYAERIELAREESWPRVNRKALFLEALRQGKYYDDIYYQIMQTLEPLWGGSWKEMEGFANYAADSTRDKLGVEMYTRVYWHISKGCGCTIIGETNADWRKMKAGFEDVLKRHPSEWNINAYAYFACGAHDKPTLKRLLQHVKTPVLPQWAGSMAFYGQCRAWAQAS